MNIEKYIAKHYIFAIPTRNKCSKIQKTMVETMVDTKFLTKKEKERLDLHSSVKSRYRELRSEYPDVSDNRLFVAIAEEMGLSTPGIRKIVLGRQS